MRKCSPSFLIYSSLIYSKRCHAWANNISRKPMPVTELRQMIIQLEMRTIQFGFFGRQLIVRTNWRDRGDEKSSRISNFCGARIWIVILIVFPWCCHVLSRAHAVLLTHNIRCVCRHPSYSGRKSDDDTSGCRCVSWILKFDLTTARSSVTVNVMPIERWTLNEFELSVNRLAFFFLFFFAQYFVDNYPLNMCQMQLQRASHFILSANVIIWVSILWFHCTADSREPNTFALILILLFILSDGF